MPLSAHEALNQLRSLSAADIWPDDGLLESLLVQSTRPIIDRGLAFELVEAAELAILMQFAPPEVGRPDHKAAVTAALDAIEAALLR